MVINRDTLNADTTYVYKSKTVKIYSEVSPKQMVCYLLVRNQFDGFHIAFNSLFGILLWIDGVASSFQGLQKNEPND